MTRDDQPQFQATVTRRRVVTPHMVRITVSRITPTGDLPAMTAGIHPDEFFGLWVPDGSGGTAKRYYSVREWRPETGELDIDMLLHGHGPATQWAARAERGEVVSFDATRGHFRPPADAQWVGVCGDAAALPAIARMLEERATAAHAVPFHTVVSVEDASDRQDLPLREGDTIRWVAASDLVEHTLALTRRNDTGYLWFSGEAADMRAVRKHVRHTLKWPTDRWMTMGYWRRDSERWLAKLEAQGPQLQAQLEEIWTSDEDEELQADCAEELLSQKGLL